MPWNSGAQSTLSFSSMGATMEAVVGDVPVANDVVLVEGRIPEQKVLGSGDVFPYVLVPSNGSSGMSALLESIRKQKPEIEACLLKSGAVLLRGFDVMTPSDFNEVLGALDYENFDFVGRGASRKAVVGRVSTTNIKPLHLPIGFHNEMAYQVNTPSKIIFYCNEEPPAGGGATPIVQGHVVYQRLMKEMPEFLRKVEEKGLTYTKSLTESGKDSWETVFQASTKEEAEEKARSLGTRIEWKPEGGGVAFMGPRIGTKFDQARCRKVWFNSIGATYELMLVSPAGEVGVTYGDGSPVEEGDMVYACKKIPEEEQVAFGWRKGDVLIVDNNAVLHARQPSKPPRSILAALCGN